MRPSVECVGTVRIPLPPQEALHLLTPEGERSWVDGWAPSYPAGGAGDPERGLVFIVGKESGASVWIVTRFEPDGDAFVRDFEDGYDAFLRGWEEDIRESLTEGAEP